MVLLLVCRAAYRIASVIAPLDPRIVSGREPLELQPTLARNARKKAKLDLCVAYHARIGSKPHQARFTEVADYLAVILLETIEYPVLDFDRLREISCLSNAVLLVRPEARRTVAATVASFTPKTHRDADDIMSSLL